MLRVKTETGSIYTVDLINRFWKKNDGPYERLYDLRVGTALTTPWDDPDSWTTAPEPEVGKHLFVACLGVWYVSTKVVEIEEVPNR